MTQKARIIVRFCPIIFYQWYYA